MGGRRKTMKKSWPAIDLAGKPGRSWNVTKGRKSTIGIGGGPVRRRVCLWRGRRGRGPGRVEADEDCRVHRSGRCRWRCRPDGPHDPGHRAEAQAHGPVAGGYRSEEHTSELQSLISISYDCFHLKKIIISQHN